MKADDEAEVLRVLAGADRGDYRVENVEGETLATFFSGDMPFRIHTPEGTWTVVVFNDCDCWDYFDHIVSPSGKRWEFPERWIETEEEHDDEMTTRVTNWESKDLKRWGLV